LSKIRRIDRFLLDFRCNYGSDNEKELSGLRLTNALASLIKLKSTLPIHPISMPSCGDYRSGHKVWCVQAREPARIFVEDPMPDANKTDFNATEAQAVKVRNAAGGPRQNDNRNYDGREPLDDPGREAVAQFLAVPTSMREFSSIVALAEKFAVTRTTVYRWMRERNVLRRADWLSLGNKSVAQLSIRQELPAITEKMAEKAKSGDIQAAKFCSDFAFPKDRRSEETLFIERAFEDAIPKF
jgi:hypothetical protein